MASFYPTCYLNGLPVYINPLLRVPNFTLSESFQKLQDPKLVEETQKWANEFFGVDDKIIYTASCIFVSEETANRMKAQLRGIYGPY